MEAKEQNFREKGSGLTNPLLPFFDGENVAHEASVLHWHLLALVECLDRCGHIPQVVIELMIATGDAMNHSFRNRSFI
jgi:hypothetical protein